MKWFAWGITILYVIYFSCDVYTSNAWKYYPNTPIMWYGVSYPMCDVVYSIGKSAVFLIGYIQMWLMCLYLRITTQHPAFWIADFIAFNCIPFAITDLWQQCHGTNLTGKPEEYYALMIFIVLSVVRITSIMRRRYG